MPIGQTVSLGRQLFFRCVTVLVQTKVGMLTRRAFVSEDLKGLDDACLQSKWETGPLV